MVSELACRIFTDVALSGAVRWQATAQFLEALRKIRECLRAPNNRRLRLQEAERLLIAALAEDQEITYAFYNLGVVYTELRTTESEDSVARRSYFASATRAFEQEIAHTPARWEAYYALAQTYHDLGRYDDVGHLCDRVIDAGATMLDRAKAYNLKAHAQRRLERPGPAQQSVESAYDAVAAAWQGLCRAEFTGLRSARAREIASHCLVDASAIRDDAVGESFHAVRRSLRHAAALTPAAPGPRATLGLIAVKRGHPRMAVRELRRAIRIDPANAFLWAALALAYRRQRLWFVRPEVRDARYEDACRRALDLLDWADTGPTIGDTLELLGDDQLAGEIRWRAAVYSAVESMSLHDAGDRLADASDWEQAQLRIRIAGLLAGVDDRAASEELRRAIDLLQEVSPAQIRFRGVRAQLALRLSTFDRRAAIQAADEALGLDPLDRFERDVLASVHFRLRDYEAAQRAWEDALLWAPDSASTALNLTLCHWHRAAEAIEPAKRREALEQARRHAEESVALARDPDERLRAHYWVGRLLAELRDFEAVIPNLRRALALEEARPLVGLLLGEACVRGGKYDSAESFLREAIAGVEEAVRSGPPESDVELGTHVREAAWWRWKVQAMAHALVAASHIEREVLLDEAQDELVVARTLMSGKPDDQTRTTRAFCDRVEGKLRARRGETDAAIELLERSLKLSVEGDVYVELAAALADRAATLADGPERTITLERALRACTLGRNLEIDPRVTESADAVLLRLRTLRDGSATTNGTTPEATVGRIVRTESGALRIS
jgi:tetratricopeptide (TPR) repeat protein